MCSTRRDNIMVLTMRRWYPRMGMTAPPPPGVPASRITFAPSVVQGNVGDNGGAGADAYHYDGDDNDKARLMILSTSAFRTLPPGPVPIMVPRSMPFSLPSLRTAGDVRTFVPPPPPAFVGY